MSTAINGFAVLEAIGRHADLFGGLRADVNKAALSLVKKHLKAKGMALADFRALQAGLTRDVLALIIEDLTDTDLKSLAKKLDPYLPDLTTAKAGTLRSHLRALADAEAEPSPKPVKAKKTSTGKAASADKKAKPAKKASTPAAWPESMSAKPSRMRG
jgi:hypothetical protein